jgi:hypothetical protein
MSKLYLFSFGLATVFLGGCASVINGVTQSVSVTTPPTQKAACVLSNNKGKWYLPSTPGTIVVHRSYNDLNVACQKPGYQNANLSVKSKANAMVAGNILIGGIIGAGVDAADGAAFHYPKIITLPMQKANVISKESNYKDEEKK